MLVALVIMAIMSLMAWQGVDGIVRARESNQVRLERMLRMETVIAQWEQDLAALQETSAVPTLVCDGQNVRLMRRTDDGLQVVVWSLRPEERGSSVWQRWAGPAVTTTRSLQDSWLRTQQFQGNETGQLRAIGRPRAVARLLLPGQRLGELPVDRRRACRPPPRPRRRRRRAPCCRAASASSSTSPPAAAWPATSIRDILIAP